MRWRSARSATTLLWVAALVSGVLHVAQARKKHYRTLGVSEKATETEIKKAYKRLALKWHPDKNPSKEAQRQFLEVKTAYETLSDPQKRREYDFSHTRSFGASYFRRSTFESHHSFPLSGASFRQKVLLERSVWVILVYSDSDPWSSRCAASWDAAARQVQPGVDAGRVNMDEQWFLATNLLQRRALVPAIVITARGQYMDRIPLRGRRPQLISGLVLASLRRLLEGRVQYAQDAAEARAFLADSSTRFLRPSGRHLPARSAHERVRILVVASSLSEMSGVAMAAEIVHGPYAGDFDVLLWEGAGTTWRKSLGLGKRGSRDWPPCGVVPRRTVDESPNIICESRSRDVFRDFLRQNRVPALPWLTRESALRQGMPPRICGPPKRCVVIAGQYSRLYSSVAVESPALDAMEGHIMAAAAFARRYPYENPLSVDGAQYAVVLLDTDAQPKFAKAIGLVGRHGAAILSGTTLTTYKDALFNSADDIIAWIRKPLCTGCDAARHTLRSRGLRTATALLESTLASELPWWDWMAETSTDIYRRLRSDQETWKKFATFAGIAVVVLVAVALLLVDLRARNGEEEGPIDEESDDGDDADPYRDGSSGRSRDDVDPRSIIPSITVPSVTDRILTRGTITVVAVHRDAAEDAAAVLASVCSRYSRDPVVFCTADYDTTALPAHDGLMYSWRKVIERDHSGVALIAAKAWKGDVSEYIGPVRPVDIAAWLDEILSGRPFSPVGRG